MHNNFTYMPHFTHIHTRHARTQLLSTFEDLQSADDEMNITSENASLPLTPSKASVALYNVLILLSVCWIFLTFSLFPSVKTCRATSTLSRLVFVYIFCICPSISCLSYQVLDRCCVLSQWHCPQMSQLCVWGQTIESEIIHSTWLIA